MNGNEHPAVENEEAGEEAEESGAATQDVHGVHAFAPQIAVGSHQPLGANMGHDGVRTED
jgi:hypothetical protein